MRTKNMLVLATVLVGLFCQEVRAFYNSSTGRWLSRDPIEEEGGANIYCFSQNHVTGAIDWLGLKGKVITLIVVVDKTLNGKENKAATHKQALEQMASLVKILEKCKQESCGGYKDIPSVALHFREKDVVPAPPDNRWDLDDKGTRDSPLLQKSWQTILKLEPGIPVLWTMEYIWHHVEGNKPTTASGVSVKGKGMILARAGLLRGRDVLAHELGHVAGYDNGGPLDGGTHSEDLDNLMAVADNRGSKPDKYWCDAVIRLAIESK